MVDDGGGIAVAHPGAVTVAGWTASSDFPTTAGSYDRTFNGVSDAFVVTLEVAPTMHVGGILPGYRHAGSGYDVWARMLIVSDGGAPVSDAVVAAEIDYPDGTRIQLTRLTGADGVAVFLRQVTDTGTYTFTVLGVAKPPSAYDPSQNIETTDSITIR